MPWPPHQVSTFKPTSAEWNAIVDALSTAQGSYNANGQVFSGFLQINITPGVDTDGLVMSPLALVSAGVQVGGRLKLRVNAYDTSNHQTDFLFRPTSRTNAGVSYLSVLYSYDSATPVELARFDTATAALRVGTMAVEATPSTFTGSLMVTGATQTTLAAIGGIELPVADGYGVKIQALSAAGAALAIGVRNASAAWTEVLRILPSGFVGIGTATPHSALAVIGLPVYATNAAAITGGLAAGDLYRTGANPDPVMVVH